MLQALDQLRYKGRGVQYLLKVIEDQDCRLSAPNQRGHQCLGDIGRADSRDSQCPGHGKGYFGRISYGRERNQAGGSGQG
jgi:hypothetical protein